MEKDSRAERIVQLSDSIGLFIEKVTGFFCVICFVVMTITALLGIFFRYVMQSSFMWTEELARYLLVWMGFVAISIALRQNKHIRIEILDKLMPAWVTKIADYGVDIFIAIFMIVFFKQGYLLTTNNIMMAATFELSMFWIFLALPVSAALALIQLVLKVVMKVCSEFIPKPESVS